MGFGLNSLAFWRCTSGDLGTGDVEGVDLELLPQRPEMLLYVPGVAWNDLNPLPEIDEPLMVLSLLWGLPNLAGGWSRYLTISVQKGAIWGKWQLSLKTSARLVLCPVWASDTSPSDGERRGRVEALHIPGRIPHKVFWGR